MLATWPPSRSTLAGLALALSASCAAAPREVEREVDGNVDPILAETGSAVRAERAANLRMPRTTAEVQLDGQAGGSTVEPDSPAPETLALGLTDSLDIAYRTNRSMIDRREDLYLTAVGLTSVRHDFQPQIGALLGYALNGSSDGPRTESATAAYDISQILGTGGSLSLGAGTAWSTTQGSGGGDAYSSVLSLQLAQPLLRGSGYAVTHESLVQAERDMIYAIRSFLLFQEGFSITVADRYYGLVRQQKTLDVQRESMDVSTFGRRKAEAMFSIGRASQIEVLRARRQELEDENRLIEAEEGYQITLDEFKVFLGIDTSTVLEIIPMEPPFTEVDWDVESAIEAAFENRLDYLTFKDRLEDSARNLRLAADTLRSDLDFTAGYTLASDAEDKFADQDLDRSAWSAGLVWRPALDRVDEKNSYRAAQIRHQRTVRELEEFEDNMIIGIRNDFRQIVRIRQSVEIQRELIADQEKNLRKAQIEFDQGTASNRDVVDAQQSLVGALNDLIDERVNYEITRLHLLQDLGILFVDENGVWTEP